MSQNALLKTYILQRGKNYQQFAENSELTAELAGILASKEDRGRLIGVDSKLIGFCSHNNIFNSKKGSVDYDA